MRFNDIDNGRVAGAGLAILGAELGALAAFVGVVAARHMTAAADICGPSAGHCALCLVAGAMGVAAVGAGGLGIAILRPRPTLRPARPAG